MKRAESSNAAMVDTVQHVHLQRRPHSQQLLFVFDYSNRV